MSLTRWFPDPDNVAAERAAAQTLRRFPAAPRVVAVCAGAGGIGATSVCAGVAATLGTLWPGRVAYVGLTDAPRLPGVHSEEPPLWTDETDSDVVRRLTAEFGVVLLDIGAHADHTARTLLRTADRTLVATDQAGRGGERARARASRAGPPMQATVVVGHGSAGDGLFAVPHDKAFRRLDDDLLDRARPATCRALLLIAAWCM